MCPDRIGETMRLKLTVGLLLLVCMGMANAADVKQSGKKGSTEVASFVAPDGPGETDEPVTITDLGYEANYATMQVDQAGFMVDTVRADSHQGTMTYDKATRRFDYAGTDGVYSGYLSATDIQNTKASIKTAYEASSCGGWLTIPCLAIPILIQKFVDSYFDGDEDDAEEQEAERCLITKRMTLNAVQQETALCYASHGVPKVDYGDMCGVGAKVTCEPASESDDPEGP